MYLGVYEANSKQTLICPVKGVGGLKRLEITEQTIMTLNLHFIIKMVYEQYMDWNV
jgi:hypothetical protein